MKLGALVAALAVALLPAAIAASDAPNAAVGFLCSAELNAPLLGSQRQLVMVAGVGTGGFAIQTTNPQAQVWFNYGLQLAHAFYHADAIEAFRKAEALDPDCAMCVWGEAWALGPTINFDRTDAEIKAAAIVAEKAARLGNGESVKNKALIGTLQVRYRPGRARSYLAYAKAMDAISIANPQDDEAAVFTSDAWMTLWRSTNDKRGLERAVSVLDPVLARHPDNTAAIHFYIHATESVGRAAIALPYAQRLGSLAPGASHLVHMASHTFFRVGWYEEAAVSNANAIAVDGAYLRATHDATSQGAVDYHAHNLSFGFAGAMASGDAPLALRFAAHAKYAYPTGPIGQETSAKVIARTYAAYGRYDPVAALNLKAPPSSAPLAVIMRHYARGEAYAIRGDSGAVRAEAAQMLTPVPADVKPLSGVGLALMQVARLTLLGRAAMINGDSKAAVAAFRAAVTIEDEKLAGESNMDPPPWWFPERRSLAAALLVSGDKRGALAAARQAIKAWPLEPLTLQVLSQAEAATGDTASAARDLALAQKGWHGSTVPLARL